MNNFVFTYHQETKHHFQRLAKSLGFLDWDNQPFPFRQYKEAQKIDLPFTRLDSPVLYKDIYTTCNQEASRISLHSISTFLRYSMGLAAWKEYGGNRWALRVNPSSGNLHPTEAYCIFPPIQKWNPHLALFHYQPKDHSLEQRAISSTQHSDIANLLPEESFLVGLSSIFWREAWKYGERAFRYCQHDVGHAIAALRLSASMLGWYVSIIPGCSGAEMDTLLGLDRKQDFLEQEPEEADLLCLISTKPISQPVSYNVQALTKAFQSEQWFGKANRLSNDHHPWPVIEKIAKDTSHVPAPTEGNDLWPHQQFQADQDQVPNHHATDLFIQRRSAQAFDPSGKTSIDTFLSILSRTLPGPWCPWDVMFWSPKIHLALFVHQVEGLTPGLYFLLRDPRQKEKIKQNLKQDFLWQQPESVPSTFPLYLLLDGDARQAAATLSCQQDIAGSSYFSLGMIADFAEPIETYGPGFYRCLFWEAGIVGQVLYLEAENYGSRGTGIGCYFDDPVHEALGIQDQTLQSMYHFTIGTPITDTRLTTLPGYEKEKQAAQS